MMFRKDFERAIEERANRVYRSPKNWWLRVTRRGGSREDAKFVAGIHVATEAKNALAPDSQSRAFAARIKDAKTPEDIRRAVEAGMQDESR